MFKTLVELGTLSMSSEKKMNHLQDAVKKDSAEKIPAEKPTWTVSVKRSDGKVSQKKIKSNSIAAIKQHFGDNFVDAIQDEAKI
jgi:hypothetical protein